MPGIINRKRIQDKNQTAALDLHEEVSQMDSLSSELNEKDLFSEDTSFESENRVESIEGKVIDI